jgi:hypothetical protein
MAFCNSCGAPLTAGTKFCNNCGAAVSGPPIGAPATPAPPASTGGSNALKIFLIIVGTLLLLGILAVITLGLITRHFITHNAHISQNGDKVKIETPFGTAETNKDPDVVARDLGVDVYPGAVTEKGSSATATFGGVHTAATNFTTSDSVDKVCAFYKEKFPNPMVSTSDQNRCTIVSNDQKNMISINIEGHGDSTRIQISNVSKAGSSTSSN